MTVSPPAGRKQMTETTAIYSLKPSVYTRAVMGRWLGRYFLLLSLPVLAAAIAGAWRVEMLVVALMLVLLVYPFALFNVYFRYALTPKAAFGVIPHRVAVDPAGNLSVEYSPDEDHPRAMETERIAAGDILSVGQSRGCVAVVYGRGCGDMLLIPLSAFGCEGCMTRDEFLRRMFEIIQRNCVTLRP